MADGFGDKLAFVLKALAISRGRLAADLDLNKSVVSRWHSGAATPSGENLSRLTRLIAQRVPGFTGLDWDRSLDELGLLFGRASAPAEHAPNGGPPPLPGGDTARAMVERHGACWEGHWWGYRQTFRDHDELVRDKIRIRRSGDFLKFDWHHDIVEGEAWFMVGDSKGYVVLPHRFAAIPAFMMFYLMDGRRVQVIDGLVTTVTIAASREMVVAPYVIVRAANLLDDPAADDAFHAARTPDDWTVDPAALPVGVAQRLQPTTSHGVMRILSDSSLARLCTPAEEAAAAAAARAAAEALGRDGAAR